MGRGTWHYRLPTTLCRTLLLYLSLATIIVGTQGQTACSPANELPPALATTNVTVDHCTSIAVSPVTYTLFYQRDNTTSPPTLSVVLGVEKLPRWYAMGFNSVEDMIGTDAVIFWQDQTTTVGHVDTYHITDHLASAVTLDSTALTYKVPPSVVVTSSNLYLSFAVEEVHESSMSVQNFAVGVSGNLPPDNGDFSGLDQHENSQSFTVDFVTNVVTLQNADPLADRKRTHGLLNVIGWGVLLPFGAIIARYARGFDPYWFYTHAAFQIVGFGLILAGLITGTSLLNKVDGINAHTHKGLAIFVFVLACIQISAILLRPNVNHKVRRYWNWGHWWLGRIALVLAAVNIFIGIHLADAGRKWKIGYGVTLGFELLLIVILEILLWINYFRNKKSEPRLPQTAMQQRESPNGTGRTAPPAYDSNNWDGKP